MLLHGAADLPHAGIASPVHRTAQKITAVLGEVAFFVILPSSFEFDFSRGPDVIHSNLNEPRVRKFRVTPFFVPLQVIDRKAESGVVYRYVPPEVDHDTHAFQRKGRALGSLVGL